MSYTANTWTAGVSPLSQDRMANLETQYAESSQSFPKGLFSAFIHFNGLTAAKDGTTASKLNVTAGTGFPQQADGTLRRRDVSAQSFTTSAVSTTYYLDLNPDGTLSWGTAHSPAANYLPICSVATDAGGTISGVSDARATTPALFPGLQTPIALNQPPRLFAGQQEPGACGLTTVASAASQSFGSMVNFKTQLTHQPTSVTFTVWVGPVNLSGGIGGTIMPLVNGVCNGFHFFFTSAAAGAVQWLGSYATVGNTIRAVDTAAGTFDHHCDGCDTLRDGIPLSELRAQTSDGSDVRASLPGRYSLAWDCVTPGCGTTEIFHTGLSAADEHSTLLTVDGTLTEGAKARLIRQAQRALGLPVLP